MIEIWLPTDCSISEKKLCLAALSQTAVICAFIQ